jgi:hypothetical protein
MAQGQEAREQAGKEIDYENRKANSRGTWY